MNWAQIIKDISDSGKTQLEIAKYCGVKQSSISDLRRGRTKSTTWEIGDRLIKLHKRVVRKAA